MAALAFLFDESLSPSAVNPLSFSSIGVLDIARNEVRNESIEKGRVSSLECRVDRGKEKHMKKKITVLTLCAPLFALSVSAESQQPKNVPRIGYLAQNDAATNSARAEAIRAALREGGYMEGQNIAFEYRYGEGKRDRLPELAAELVRLKVDIIVVAGGTAHVQAARNATKTIPII
jgi:hypothetical protein